MNSSNQNIILKWFWWHFYEAPKFLFSVWENFLFFTLHFFSIPLLLATLFYPWKRYQWNYPRGFDIGEFFSTFISNMFSRVMGALCRLLLILLGVISQGCVLLIGGSIILFWFLMPIIWILLLLFLMYGF